jgi:ferredoxin
VQRVAGDVKRNDDRCYQCGTCTSVCPTGALHVKRPEMEIVFDPDKCSACELCCPVCPARAMEVAINRNAVA